MVLYMFQVPAKVLMLVTGLIKTGMIYLVVVVRERLLLCIMEMFMWLDGTIMVPVIGKMGKKLI